MSAFTNGSRGIPYYQDCVRNLMNFFSPNFSRFLRADQLILYSKKKHLYSTSLSRPNITSGHLLISGMNSVTYIGLLACMLATVACACPYPCASNFRECGIDQSCWDSCRVDCGFPGIFDCANIPCLRGCSKSDSVSCLVESTYSFPN